MREFLTQTISLSTKNSTSKARKKYTYFIFILSNTTGQKIQCSAWKESAQMFNFILKGPETAPTADTPATAATGGAPALTANEVTSFALFC